MIIVSSDTLPSQKQNTYSSAGCAGTHKEERNKLVQRLQGFAARKHVRITILSGDVHLACVGRFFSKASLNIPQVEKSLQPFHMKLM